MHVFISYRHRSGWEAADRVQAALQSYGIPVWRDKKDIEEGEGISPAVEAGLRAAIGAVVIYTDDYLDSTGCFLELATIVARLHHVTQALPVLVINSNGNTERIAPLSLRDIRSTCLATPDSEVASLELYASVLRERLALDEKVGKAYLKLPLGDIFGTIDVAHVLTVPCGHERKFWQLHDLLHPEATSQTKVTEKHGTVVVASVFGGGAVDLLLSYSNLLGSTFPGGIFFLRDDGNEERLIDALRDIGMTLGVSPEDLGRVKLRDNIESALGVRERYLWIVVRSGAREATHGLAWAKPPTPNGTCVVVLDGAVESLEPQVHVGPLDRCATARLLSGLVGFPLQPEFLESLYARTHGHLPSLKAVAALIRTAGVELADKRLAEMSDEELGLRAYREALAAMDSSVRELLLAFAALPAETVLPNAVTDALFGTHAGTRPESQPLRYEHFVKLLALGAVAQIPDRSATFVVRAWREAAVTLASMEDTGTAVLRMGRAIKGSGGVTEEILRRHLVNALLTVLPRDTRTRKTKRLHQLASLAQGLLTSIKSEEDCELAVHCAAVYALYRESTIELAVLMRAFDWAKDSLGPQHTKTLELLAECTQCRDFPSKSAVTLLLTALKELPPDDPRIALRLRLAHQCAIFIGDESPTEAQSFLEEAYRPFAESPKVEPLQHVRIRNSLAVFGLRFSENTALATWQGAREILNRAGLGNLQEAVRLDANIASSIAKRNPAEAAAMAKSIFIRQLNEFGIDHHLALWAAMDYLQYALSAGLWREAFELLAVHLARLQWPEPLSGGNLFENRLSPKAPYGFTAPLPLSNHEAVWSLERIHHIESVTLPSIIKGVGPCPPTVTPEDEVMVTRILLELLKFRMGTDGIAFFVIDRFLKRRYRLRGIDWLALTDTMRRYYLRFSGCTDRSWSSRRAMRRLARASLGNPSILERLFLKKTCARHGLPTTDL